MISTQHKSPASLLSGRTSHFVLPKQWGLATSVWTRDIDRAWHVARALQSGTVWVNGYNRSYPAIPSGGYKMSGLGRTLGFPRS